MPKLLKIYTQTDTGNSIGVLNSEVVFTACYGDRTKLWLSSGGVVDISDKLSQVPATHVRLGVMNWLQAEVDGLPLGEGNQASVFLDKICAVEHVDEKHARLHLTGGHKIVVNRDAETFAESIEED